MKIPPVFTITSEILALISKIEANKIYFSSINIPLEVKDKIQRISTLKSSLFSARIEGNPLFLEDLNNRDNRDQKKREVFNILNASKFISTGINRTEKITKDIICNLHAIAMEELPGPRGKFRQEPSAIFNSSGFAVYMAPAPKSVYHMMDELVKYINSNQAFPLIQSFVSHLVFEKIHPFLDGNGRVGRLLIFLILKTKDQNYNLYIPFEQYLDEHREEYYFHLDQGLKDTNNYLIFMLNAFHKEMERMKELVEKELAKKEEIFLPPRQEEIFNIVKDHIMVSFDMIRRRFLKVPERTLRYDLKKLLDKELIIKIGKTRGSYYRIKQ